MLYPLSYGGGLRTIPRPLRALYA
ncbi:MAG: hypothetical protein QOE43_2311, partial [Gaiellaceae bacterium]|nr:hypothetical protein [Gaiellaceae bacterium]